MGYTTDFEGSFTFTTPPPAETLLLLMDCYDAQEMPPGLTAAPPEGYNQWQLTQGRRGLEWDGGEKFYHYVEWLQYLLDHVLQPVGVSLTGCVQYQGESIGDTGTLTVEEGRVVKRKAAVVNSTDLAELQAFYAFVVASRYGQELVTQWQRERMVRQR
jgi:hypothetical protein